MDRIKVLAVGSGGREHAICSKIAQSPLVDNLYAAPGNPGIAEIAECIPIKVNDIIGLRHFALNNNIGLTVVGPEGPLAVGIVDAFQECGLKIFGPTRRAALIEADKEFAMSFLRRHSIPTGWYQIFYHEDHCLAFVKDHEFPAVLKNPYLAAGKGAFICDNYAEAQQAVSAIQLQQEREDWQYPSYSGVRFLVMEYLKGEEVSITAISDGKHLVYLPSSQDHKRLEDGDKGPMTGGMGAIAPAPFVTPELQQKIHEQIMLPTVRVMAEKATPYKGVLYAGIILTDRGPKVLEFNCRFGDPETQAILVLLETDLVELMLAAIDGTLDKVKVAFHSGAAACVVMAAEGYGTLEHPRLGDHVFGVDTGKIDDYRFYYAGIERRGASIATSRLLTTGGRVLGVSGSGYDLPVALAAAYRGVGKVDFRGKQFRTDIGQRALAYLAGNK